MTRGWEREEVEEVKEEQEESLQLDVLDTGGAAVM